MGYPKKYPAFATATGTNTIAVTSRPQGPTAYYDGLLFGFTPAVDNTDAVTLNINGLGAKAVKKHDGATALAAGDLQGGGSHLVRYDGTYFQLLNPAQGLGANVMSTLGDTTYGGASGAVTRLAGNAGVSNKFLRSKGDGAAAAPSWEYNGAIWSQSADVTRASFTSAVTLLGTGVGIKTLPADTLAVGDSIEIELWGYYSDTSTPDYTFTIKLGAVTLGTFAITAAAGSNNSPWRLTARATCQTAGGSGKVKIFARLDTPGESTTSQHSAPTTQSNADTTGTLAVDVTITCSASSSSNTITCSGGNIKLNKVA